MTRALLAVLAGLLLTVAGTGAATQSSQSPPGQEPTFRGGVHTVSIYASVVDTEGRLVTDLTREDFEVYDDGKRQDLTLFANDLQPITVVIMLDRSGSVSQHFSLVRDAAQEFVANLNGADRARIGSFSKRVQVDPPVFTSDTDELVRILREELQGAGPTPLWNAAGAAMRALAQEKGRRVVLMFTDGHDNPDGPGPNTTFWEVRDRAQIDEIMVYGIGLAKECGQSRLIPSGAGPPLFQRRPPPPRGPIRVIPPRIGRPPRFPTPLPPVPGGPPRRPGGDPYGGRPSPLAPADPCLSARPDPALRELALESGGGYFELRDAERLGATFARVAEELHHQYLLGFTPAVLDGRSHALEVRLRDKDFTVRARKSYLAQAK
jgi:VWFA-related protein